LLALGDWSPRRQSSGRTNFYDRPTGLIMYDPSGRMCVNIVLKADRKPFAPIQKDCSPLPPKKKPPPLTPTPPISAPTPSDAKTGTISHHLEDNLIPGRQGTDNVRWFEFQGDNRLLLIPVEDGKGGVLARKDATYKLLWETPQVAPAVSYRVKIGDKGHFNRGKKGDI